MKTDRLDSACRLGLSVFCIAAVLSCASSGGSPESPGGELANADRSRKTQQQVQSELMAFADRYFAASLDAARILEQSLETPESRYTAAGARLVSLVVTTDIAASPNPAAAVLDMTVFVTLRRMVWEEHWMPGVYGEAGRPVLDALRELEDDIWAIAAGVYTPDQLTDLRGLIDAWRSSHPDVVAVDFVRLSELGDSRRVQDLVNAGRSGGMLAPVKETNRELEEMRLLAERLAFMATRLQLLLSLQVEMASAKLAVQPEFRQLLEDSRNFAEVSDRFAEAFATLVADLPEERRAAIDQILSGLGEERERFLADVTAEDSGVRPTLGDFRDTFEAGSQLAARLDEAIISAERLIARMLEEEPVRPFDIMDYRAIVNDATVTVRELQTVLASIERILDSAVSDDEMNTILEGANRLEDEVIDEIVDRAFLRGAALIVIFFVVLTLHKLLIRRIAPGPSSERPEAGP